MLADRQHAEDVVQEVFGTVWRRAATFDPARGRVRTWLLTQVHHRAVDLVRREEAERRRPKFATDPSVPSSDEVVEDEWLVDRRRRVTAALDQLPDEQREVIELAYFGGLTQTQVAAARKIPLGTVKSRTLAGLRRLRSILGEEP
jgi:RNA polymerase sigma-70 factor (ECF subfamily)